MARPRVEQRRRARQVRERGHQPVEPDRFGRGPRQAARDPEEEVLRALDHQPGSGVPQQVPVIDGLDAEVFKLPVRLMAYRVIELARIILNEPCRLLPDKSFRVAQADRLAEGRDALAAYLLADVGSEQPGRQPRVLRLFAGHLRRGLDREPVEFGGGRPVVQAADRLGRHPQRVDLFEPVRAPLDGTHDLVDVHRLGVPAPLADVHGRATAQTCAGIATCHGRHHMWGELEAQAPYVVPACRALSARGR